MNKIYRTVWNESTQSWVAVSELAKSAGKSSHNLVKEGGSLKSGVFKATLSVLSAVIGLTVSAQTYADPYYSVKSTEQTAGSNYNNDGATGTNALAAGVAAKAIGAAAVVVGYKAESVKQNSVAIGTEAKTESDDSVAIGLKAKVTNHEGTAVAIGANTTAGNKSAVAIGNRADATGTESAAFGSNTTASGASALAMGPGAKATALSASAFGNGAQALGDRSTALGQGALARNRDDTVVGTGANTLASPQGGWAIAIGVNTKGHGVASFGAGYLAEAKGDRATALGAETVAEGSYTTALGRKANAKGDSAIALGNEVNASAANATAIGQQSKATHGGAVAIGNKAESTNNQAVSIGEEAKASGQQGSALGYKAQATGTGTTALGLQSTASGDGSTAIGSESKASEAQTVAIGQSSTAAGKFDVSIGYEAAANSVTTGNNIAIGQATLKAAKASNNNIAVGTSTGNGLEGVHNIMFGAYTNSLTAVGDARTENPKLAATLKANYTVAMGSRALANATNAIAIGTRTHALGDNSIAGGVLARSKGAQSIALGMTSIAEGTSSIAIGGGRTGSSTLAKGGNAIALGYKAIANAQDDIAIGSDSKANGGNTGGQAIAIGNVAEADGLGTTAVGNNTKAMAEGAQAFGQSSQATAKNSAAIGRLATASADRASAFGVGNTASGESSLAMGDKSVAQGKNSIAAGTEAKAETENSIAVGYNAQANTNTGAIAIGADSVSSGQSAVAIGKNSKGAAQSVVAIGDNSNAAANNSVAIGIKANAQGTGNVAIGESAGKAHATSAQGNNTVVIGVQAGAEAGNNQGQVAVGWEAGKGALGTYNVASGYQAGQYVQGDNNVALGKGAGMGTSASRLVVNDTVALGSGAKATLNSAVALGSGSVADVGANQVGADPLNAATAKNNSTWTSTDAAVSVGNGTTKTRQITSVAAGTQDIDAVNVAQLKASGFKLNATHAGGGESTSIADDKIQNGETVTVDAGKNIKVTHTANTVSIATKDEVEFTKTTVGNVVIDSATNKISGVEKGENDKDAVNVKQLKDEIAGSGWEIQGNNDKKDDVRNGDKVNFINGDNTTATVTNAGTTTSVKYDVKTSTLTTGTNGTVTAGTPNNAFATAGDVASAINAASFTLASANNGTENTTTEQISAGEKVTVNAGKNLTATQTGSTITLATKDDVEFNTAKIGPVTINADGINAGNKQITGVESGGNVDSNAANIADVKKAKTEVKAGTNVTIDDSEVTADGHKVYKVNADGTKVEAATGSLIKVTPGTKDATTNITTYTVDLEQAAKDSLAKANTAVQDVKLANGEANLTLNKANNVVELGLSKTPIFDKVTAGTGTNQVVIGSNGVEVGSNVYISDAGLNANNKVISQVAPGQVGTDAVNVDQLKVTTAALGGNAQVNTDGSVTAPSYTIRPTDGGATQTVNNVGDALTALNDQVVKPLTIAGNTGTFDRTLGSTTTISGGLDTTKTASNTNVRTVASNGTVDIQLADAPTFTGKVSAKGLDAGGEKITSVKAGDLDDDAVNVKQLKDEIDKVNVAAGNSGWEIQGNSDKKDDVRNGDKVNFINGDNTTATVAHAPGTNTTTVSYTVNGTTLTTTDGKVNVPTATTDIATAKSVAEAINATGFTFKATAGDGELVSNTDKFVKTGDTVTAIADKNIKLTQANGELRIATKDNVEFTSVKAGDSTLNNDGLTITGGPSVKKDGINAGNKQITGVESGAGNDKNAANIGDVKTAAAAAKTEVKGGKNVTKVTKTQDAADSHDIYTIDVDGAKVATANDDAISLTTSAKDADGITTYTLDLGTKTKASLAKADTALQNVVTAAGETNLTANKVGDTVTLDFKEDPTFTKTTVGNVIIDSATNKITGVEDGTIAQDSKDVVNGGQLHTLKTKGFKVNADNNDAKTNALEATVSIVAGNATDTSTDNLATKVEQDGTGTKVTVSLKNAPTFAGKVTAQGGFDAANNKITGVEKGENDKDAVNFAQLKEVQDAVKVAQSGAWELQGAGTTVKAVGAGDKVNFIDGTGTTASVTKVGEVPTISYSVNTATLASGADGKITPSATGDVFATATQVADAINAASFTLASANNGTENSTTEQISAGEKVTVNAGKNLTTSQTGGVITVATKEDVEFTSVKAGDSTLNGDGLTITGGPSVKKDGIDAADKQIKNVASGVGDDENAANIGDVKAVRTKVNPGTNVSVSHTEDTTTGAITYTVNADGTKVEAATGSPIKVTPGTKDTTTNITTYTVDLEQAAKDSLAKANSAVQDVKLVNGETNLTLSKANNVVELGLTKTPTFEKVTAGTGANQVVIGSNGVEVGSNVYISDAGLNANDKVITNVAAGTADKHAVNVSQLKPMATALGTTVAADGTVAAPSFVVTKVDGSQYAGTPTVQGALDNIGTEIKRPITFAGNSGTNFDRTLGSTVKVKGSDTLAEADSSTANITTVAKDGDTIELRLANAPTFTGKVSAKGFDAGGQAITNVGPGAAGSTEAVNVQQLEKAILDVSTNASNNGWEIQGNGTKVDNDNVRNNDIVNFANGTTTTATVTSADNKTSVVKYEVNQSTLTTAANGTVSAGTPNNAFATAGDVANAINAASFNLTSANAGTTTGVNEQINAGDTVTVNAGKNLTASQAGGTITLATKDDVEFTSAKIGPVTIDGNGINAGNKQITGVDSGGNVDSNAANIGDVKKAAAAAKTTVVQGTNVTVTDKQDPLTGAMTYTVNADGTKVEADATSPVTVTPGTKDPNTNITTYKVDLTQAAKDSLANVATNTGNITALQNQTFKLQANSDTATSVKASDTVKFIDGQNINITRNGNDITVATKKDVSFDKVTVGAGPNQTVLGNNGVEVGGNVYVSNAGLNANNKVITNVAPGALNDLSTDAVNGSQLHATNKIVQDLSVNVAAAKVEVHAGNNVRVDQSKGGSGQNIYTVHAEKTTVSGSSTVNVTAGPTSPTGVTNYAVDLSQQVKNDIAEGVAAKNIVDTQGLTFNADSGTTGVKKLGESVAVNGDNKNITTKATTNGVEVSLNKSISVANVAADGVHINYGPSISKSGINMNNQPIVAMASSLPIDPVTGKPMTTVQIEQGILDGTIDPAVLQSAVNIGDLATQAQNVVQVNRIIYGSDQDGNPYINGNGTMTSAGRAALRTYNVDGSGTAERNGIFDAIKNMNEQGIKFFHTNDGVVKSVKDGHSEEDSNAEAAYSTAIGYQAVVTEEATAGLAIGAGSRATAEYSVAIGAESEAVEAHVAEGNANNAYTYGGVNDDNVAAKATKATRVASVGVKGKERQVQHVAAGVVSPTSTDAVNGSQLYYTNKAVENNSRAINQLRGDVHRMDKKLRAGVAGAYAAASLGQVYIPGKTQVSLGSGHYRGESAVALGVSRVSDNGKVQVRLIGSTNTRGDTGAGASVSYLW